MNEHVHSAVLDLQLLFRPHCSRHSFHLSTCRCTKGISTTALLETCITLMGIATMTKWTLPEQGCTAQDTSFHPEQQQVELPLLTEKLRWKCTGLSNAGSTQNHWLHPRSRAAEDTKMHKWESFFITPSFSLHGVVMFRNASVWISHCLLSVWDTSDAIHPAYQKTFAWEISSESPLNLTRVQAIWLNLL